MIYRFWTQNAFRAAVAVVALLLLSASSSSLARDASALVRVSEDIRFLASDELEGRGPGTKGLEQAAKHIRDEFQRLGLKSGGPDGSYMQPFRVPIGAKVVAQKTTLALRSPNEKTLEIELGHSFQPMAIGGSGKAKAGIVFAGYGISAPKLKYDDYQAIDASGKVLIIIRREPQQDDPNSVFDGKKVTSHSFIRTKLTQAKSAKAAAVLFVNDAFTTASKKKDELVAPNGFGGRAMGVPFAHLTQATVDELLEQSPVKSADGDQFASVAAIEKEIDHSFQPLSQSLDGWSAELEFTFEKVDADVANVIGVLEGEGPLAHETVILGAHYDHLGFGGAGSRRPAERAIHNGADDNASGTAAILELARRWAQQEQRPPRRLVFIAFSAEERGLVGSNYYIQHPSFPLKDTVAMLNFDMVGRLRNRTLTVMGAGSGKEFSDLLDRADNDEQLELKKVVGTTASGDHFGFYRREIPCLHFCTGFTNEYHTPEDDFETINVEGVVQTVDFSERVLDAVLGLAQRPQFVKAGTTGRAVGPSAYVGITLATGGTGGVPIASVADDSPADRAGLQPGDVIVQLDDTPIANAQGLFAVLIKSKPGKIVRIVVQRDGEKVTCSVTLGRRPGG
ncbi:MAG: M20/M25/M40 family metallo-hydrolase [Planctomycetes bacterium]|nr:M20/M25/M40 family metallo-hydrolase [Planctomycetota bacterium]MBL7039920.1 M20/M25/M40 family metallo-hydrolase [Pirellulaceae bacterium]